MGLQGRQGQAGRGGRGRQAGAAVQCASQSAAQDAAVVGVCARLVGGSQAPRLGYWVGWRSAACEIKNPALSVTHCRVCLQGGIPCKDCAQAFLSCLANEWSKQHTVCKLGFMTGIPAPSLQAQSPGASLSPSLACPPLVAPLPFPPSPSHAHTHSTRTLTRLSPDSSTAAALPWAF